MTLSVGQVVADRYRIVKLLGKGGFGAVYRAWDTRLSRPCALKENLDSSEEAGRQFAKEATILANLKHPNLPRVLDHFTVAGQAQYLVMDYVEGEDLQEMLDRRGSLPGAEVLPWIVQVCEALAYLHDQSQAIIHRDVKPANIKITLDGTPMLVDFGIAKIYDPALRTTVGARAVTPGYSPPEQYGQGRTDARSDIYALGATLYALLTGKEPVDSVERLIDSAALVPPRKLNPHITEPLSHVIEKAMMADPKKRFQTIGEFRTALRSVSRPICRAGEVAETSAGGAPRISRGRVLAIVSLALGVLSWVLACAVPATMMSFQIDRLFGSAASGFGLLASLCGGFMSVPAALIVGTLALSRYRTQIKGLDRLMAIAGMVSVALLALLTIVLLLVYAVSG